MIAFCNPIITELSENKIVIRIKVNPLTRNHLGSMYLDALTIGADLAVVFMPFIYHSKVVVSFLWPLKTLKQSFI